MMLKGYIVVIVSHLLWQENLVLSSYLSEQPHPIKLNIRHIFVYMFEIYNRWHVPYFLSWFNDVSFPNFFQLNGRLKVRFFAKNCSPFLINECTVIKNQMNMSNIPLFYLAFFLRQIMFFFNETCTLKICLVKEGSLGKYIYCMESILNCFIP